MLIRNAEIKDRHNYLEMTRIFYSGDATAYPVDDNNFCKGFDEALHTDSLRIVVLEDKGYIIGYSVLTFFYSIEFGGTIVLLDELFIKPDVRGKGYGQEFFKWIFKEYKEFAGYMLDVTKTNERAIKLYDQLGFEQMKYMRMIKQNKKSKKI